MKQLVFVLLLLFSTKIAFAQYNPVNEGSEVKFKIGNFGFDVAGSFTGFQGNISFDPKKPANSNFDVTIEASTVTTDNTLRDEHLKGESYFDIKNYRHIRFVSRKITAANKNGMYTITGQLTIKDKSKEVSFPFTAMPSGDGYVFKGIFRINRKDFGVGGSSTIANELEVSLSVVAKKKAEQ